MVSCPCPGRRFCFAESAGLWPPQDRLRPTDAASPGHLRGPRPWGQGLLFSPGAGTAAGCETCVSSFQTLLENPTLFHDVCGAAAPGDGVIACCQGWACIRGSPPHPSGRLLTLFIIFFPFLSVPCLRPSRHLRLRSSRIPAAAGDRPRPTPPASTPWPAPPASMGTAQVGLFSCFPVPGFTQPPWTVMDRWFQ